MLQEVFVFSWFCRILQNAYPFKKNSTFGDGVLCEKSIISSNLVEASNKVFFIQKLLTVIDFISSEEIRANLISYPSG